MADETPWAVNSTGVRISCAAPGRRAWAPTGGERRIDDPVGTARALFVVIDRFTGCCNAFIGLTVELFRCHRTRLGRSRCASTLAINGSTGPDRDRLAPQSYRICLKTLTTAESRAVLGVGDAARLTGNPGAALLRSSRALIAQTIYVGSPDRYRRRVGANQFGSPSAGSPPPSPHRWRRPVVRPPPTLLDTVVNRLRWQGSRAHAIWLPPLTASPELGQLRHISAAELTATIGLVDLPFEQRRRP